MATNIEIEALEQKLKAARAERELDAGGLLALPPEEVSIQEFTARETALRLADPIAFMAMQRQMMIKAYETLMIKDQDYGKVSGCGDKPMLFKAGAEKAANLFNLSIRVECVKEIENEEKEYFSYTYKATVLNRSGRIISECEGNCNSREKKYRYRWVSESYATEDQKRSQVARKKFDGKNYYSIQVPNPDIYDQLNTLIKMAQKRAIVGAVLIATNSSAFFGNAELESNHGFEVPEDRPTWDAEIVEDEPTQEPITVAQIKRLYAIAKTAGHTKESLHKLLEDMHGIASVKDISPSQYDRVCKDTEHPAMVDYYKAQSEPAPGLD